MINRLDYFLFIAYYWYIICILFVLDYLRLFETQII